MAKLVYSTLTSLDGYIADADGTFEWAAPDEEVHAFINALERPVGTHLYGRRMYDVMAYWETVDVDGEPDCIAEYAGIWRAADKIVYSRTLDDVSTERTRLERQFDREVVRRLKTEATRDISIGGAELAAHALEAGLVDEYHLFAVPVIVGGGTRALPDGVRLRLELLDERRFDNGTVYLRYSVSEPQSPGPLVPFHV
jgi:dihydrofolate reductase